MENIFNIQLVVKLFYETIKGKEQKGINILNPLARINFGTFVSARTQLYICYANQELS